MTRRLALGPEVHGDRVCFTLPDPGPSVRSVALEVHPVIRGPKELHRLAPGCAWVLDLPRPDVQRLEYRFRLRGAGHEGLILDPANPGRVATAFGERSVLELPGYAAPTWLGDDAPVGTFEAMMVDGELADPVPVTVWQPHGVSADDPLPLLVVQDGPEYAELAALTRFSAALVAGGRLPPHRLALCQPVHRNAWYSASVPYLRTLTGPVLDHLTHRYAGCSPIVVMGASLGGVTALLAATARRDRIAGVFAQSGSFFRRRTDGVEPTFGPYQRITRRVGALLRAPATRTPLRVGITCGALEGNAANNRAMAAALAAQGHLVSHAEVPDLHNFTAWRDALDPHLTDVLLDVWNRSAT